MNKTQQESKASPLSIEKEKILKDIVELREGYPVKSKSWGYGDADKWFETQVGKALDQLESAVREDTIEEIRHNLPAEVMMNGYVDKILNSLNHSPTEPPKRGYMGSTIDGEIDDHDTPEPTVQACEYCGGKGYVDVGLVRLPCDHTSKPEGDLK